MTLEELRQSGCIIFECISGSRAYGLDTATSDTDIRGVFVLPKVRYFGLDYVSQINNETNDIVYYELRKFVELCAKNNPNILELLNVPERCVVYRHPLFDRFKMNTFLSKQCKKTFANYAYAQISKARGLAKKITNPVARERKSALDFCFVYSHGKSVELEVFLASQHLRQEDCGLSRLPHMKDCYGLFHSENIPYKGVIKNKQSNNIALSTIPKGETALGLMFFNQDGYSAYCKKYRDYWDWVEKRNEQRYKTTISHGKNYDSKNMMHTFRLLRMAKEIALDGVVNVQRSDREFLLDVKSGVFEYDDLVAQAEELRSELDTLYERSSLPDLPQMKVIEELLVEVREEFYRFGDNSKV